MNRRIAVLAATVFACSPGLALALDASLPPAAGQVKLGFGFLPDPHEVAVQAGGTSSASEAGDACYGYVSPGPTYRVFYTAGAAPLLFILRSDEDAVIVVQAPDGTYSCNDDMEAGSHDSLVQYDTPATGAYTIWAGTYGSTPAPATIQVSEDSSVIAGGRLDWTLDPVFGTVDLNAGFTPDPHVVAATAGGNVDASLAADDYCRGYVTEAPALRLNYQPGGFPLYIFAMSEADTTLVVNAPNGDWLCDDDSGPDVNPMVEILSPEGGQYDIWFGTYSDGPGSDGSIVISETAPDTGDDFDFPDFTQLDPAAPPVSGEMTLTSGFDPDPRTAAVLAGGEYDAFMSSADPSGDLYCDGAITQAPTYRLTYTPGAWPLIISVDTGEDGVDTTLIIQDPDGVWHCDDDGGELRLNPSIRFDTPVAGTYNIWVGDLSYAAAPPPATLYISEIETR